MIANPIIAVAAAVAGLAVAISSYSKKQREARREAMTSGKSMAELQSLIAAEEQKLADLANSSSRNKSQEARKIKKTLEIYNSQLDVLKQEKIDREAATKATQDQE